MTTESTSAQYPASEAACRISAGHVNQVRPKLPLLKILHAAGAQGDTFTLKEVMHYLGQYIMVKQLYDKQQQHLVHCGNDPLGELLGIQSFSVKDPSLLYNMLRKNLTSAPLKDAAQTLTLAKDLNADTLSQEQPKFTSQRKTKECPVAGKGMTAESRSSSPTISQRKRQNPEEAEDLADPQSPPLSKQPKLDLVFEEWDVAGLPWWFIGNLRSNYGCRSNGSTDIPSNKDGDTALASDTTDDLWFLAESDNERYSMEVKVEAVDSDCSTDIEEEDKEKNKEVLEDKLYEEELEDTQCLSDTDTDIVSEDCWQCTKCKKFNSPMKRYCFRCWALRKDWYSDCPKLLHSLSTPNITAKKGKKKEEEDDGGIDIPDCRRTVSDPIIRTADQHTPGEKLQTPPCGSLESLDLSLSNPSITPTPSSNKKVSKSLSGVPAASPESNREIMEPCRLCRRRPRNGNIIHGKTAHLVTCFSCARMLQKFKSPCPACKQQIQLVIKTFIA